MDERIGLHEGSIGLPAGFEDRTSNLFVPADPQNQPNLSIGRDHMHDGETPATYVDRQLLVLKARLPGHKVLARAPAQLGRGDAAIDGERIDAQYKNGAHTVRQRQAAFAIAPNRALILTASSPRPFDAEFDALWDGWLASFVQPAAAGQDAGDAS